MTYIIVLILIVQLVLLGAIKSKGLLSYWLISVALLLLILIQLSKNASDPNLDPLIFATSYTSDHINDPTLIGRHFLIPYISLFSSILPSSIAYTPFHKLVLSILLCSFFFAVMSLRIISRTKAPPVFLRAFALFLLFAISCPSSILLFNNFISQAISAMLCITAFCILSREGKSSPILMVFAIFLLLLSVLNHSSSLYLIVLYAFQSFLLIVLKRFQIFSLSMSSHPVILGSAALSLAYMSLLSFISAFLMTNDGTTDYVSGFDDVAPERLFVRILYPFAIAAVVFPLSHSKLKLAFDSPLFRVSIFASLSAILIFMTGMKGVAWRLEYYASFLAAFSFCTAYSFGRISLVKNLLNPIRIFILLFLSAIPYCYSNISRLFV